MGNHVEVSPCIEIGRGRWFEAAFKGELEFKDLGMRTASDLIAIDVVRVTDLVDVDYVVTSFTRELADQEPPIIGEDRERYDRGVQDIVQEAQRLGVDPFRNDLLRERSEV